MKTNISCLFAALALFAGANRAGAQGTAFTYQGQLYDGTNLANGLYDIRGGLYATNTGGTLITPLYTNSAVPVSNGLFIITFDFGGIFGGTNYWLQIGVRTNGTGAGFTPLNGRQQLTPTPYAIFAEGANAAGLTGTIPTASLNGTYGAVVNLTNLANSFSGNGGGLTNLNAWRLAGNSGTTAGANFAGTTDNQPYEIHVNGLRALRMEPTPNTANVSNAVNVIHGSPANSVIAGVQGATIGGGGATYYFGPTSTNIVADNFGTIGGGVNNVIQSNAFESTIGGGNANSIQPGAYRSTIAGGWDNTIGTNANHSFIGGGYLNLITGQPYAVIGGGYANTNTSGYTFIGGGFNNTIQTNCNDSVIGAGLLNTIQSNADQSVIGGGNANIIQTGARESFVGGGFANVILTNSAICFIGGGARNTIQSNTGASTIGGGFTNTIKANVSSSFIGGGVSNTVAGNYATVAGGSQNSAAGDYSFAAGDLALASHQGAFVWADSQGAAFASTTNDEFSVRAQNGVRIQAAKGIHLDPADEPMIVRDWNPFATNAPADKAGIGRWGLFMEPNYLTLGIPSNDIPGRFFQVAKYSTNGTPTMLMQVDQSGNVVSTGTVTANGVLLSSDRNVKENFTPVVPQTVLEKVAALPMSEWQFKTTPGERHLGPMAQDFRAAFGLGVDEKHIAVVDEGGVALAAIQGLNQKLEETRRAAQDKDAEIKNLKQQNDSLAERLNDLEATVKQLAEKNPKP